MQGEPRRPQRQDTFDLREDIRTDDVGLMQAHADAAALHYGTDEEEHSILEDDSEQEETEELYEDDMSSTLSIPNESIDFDMVYALHSFAATVEGQANVVKGDSLFLMDDSNSYWWLVRVLKTQEVGYIPAENIETPFERLARLNKHRNVDLALATTQEQQEGALLAQERMQINAARNATNQISGRNGSRANNRRSVHFNSIRSHHRYVPALRDGEIEDEEDEWDTDGFEDEDLDLVDEMYMDDDDLTGMEIDENMAWDEGQLDDTLSRQAGISIPDALLPGSLREQQQQQILRAQQQQQVQQQEMLAQQQRERQQQLLQQQQQQQLEAQAAQQAQQQAAEAQRQQQLQQQAQRQDSIRPQSSREQLVQEGAQTQTSRRIDPADVTETRKMTVTPSIARDINPDERPADQPRLPSITIEEERKRSRDDDASSDDSSKKRNRGKDKLPPPVSSSQYNKSQSGKLRKERSNNSDNTDDEGKEKKKKNSVFGGLFGRGKKDKGKDNKAHTSSFGSMDSAESLTRSDETAGPKHKTVPSSDGTTSPTTAVAQQQQIQLTTSLRNPSNSIDSLPTTPDRANPPVSISSLRQRDQQQQALYQKYLNSSPSSPPEAQPSYGLQSASTVMLSSPTNSALGPPAPRARPGSLIITNPSGIEAPSLSVIRVFAGRNLQTEATFKTVLLNPSTTSNDLVRQALQRFRLPAGEAEDDYYLTVKQVEGGAFAVLEADEKPLVVFEQLVNETMELPKVKRSSVGSISSIASNLSMHPAIKKLSMNDFTDDSAVKFYLNRRGDGLDDSLNGHDDDETITVDTSHTIDPLVASPVRSQFLSPTGLAAGSNVTLERFTSPSIRFALQVVIYAEDLPDDMQFHPTTEAIVYKNSLHDPSIPIVVSPTLRRKIFMFPKNVTVAEVTELGLERFGIQDGVVDGGDEVEDKTTKRRSGIRVRYGLTISIDGQERELPPSSKVVDAYPRPPQYRNNTNTPNKRRSLDPSQISFDDIRPDDPVFVLRRATSYRHSASRRRSSVPLDELALAKIHRESSSSLNSDGQNPADDSKLKQPSRQEIITAQRAAQRATQKAIVSATTNSVRGFDVMLPGNAMLRSSRYDTGDRMRYSYVEADGETYDISDIVEEEWKDGDNGKDLLEGMFKNNKDGIDERLDRFINKIKKGKGKERDFLNEPTEGHRLSTRSISPSEYSVDDENLSRSVTPGSAGLVSRMPNGIEMGGKTSRPGTVTPTTGVKNNQALTSNHTRRNPSVTSVASSEYSTGRGTPIQSNLSRVEEEVLSHGMAKNSPQSRQQRRVILPKDDFGLSHMMSIIEYKSLPPKTKEKPPQHPIDEMVFGAPIEPESLHPDIRDIYAPAFKQLEEMDKILDSYIGRSVVGAF